MEGARLAAAHADLEARGLARTVLVDSGGRPRLVTSLLGAETRPADPAEAKLRSL